MALEARDLPHYTYEDYERWEGRWELIYGIPYAMSPQPNLRHQIVSGNIHAHLTDLLRECGSCRALLPVDWKIADDIILQPDNLVVCAEVSGQYLTVPPVLVFEILSPSTASKDRNLKYRIFEQEGVRYYVLVDPAAGRADVFELEGGAYARRLSARSETVAFDLGPCTIDFDFAPLWR